MKAFHHKQPFDPAGNVHASSVTRTMKGQSLDTWDMFTRESLQNSWDARDRTSNEDGVTFAIDYQELGPEQVDTLRYDVFDDDVTGLEGLEKALISGNINLLSVADSGTYGLRGPSIASAVTKDDSAPRDFDAFVRNIGRSDSKALQGGTYGFGKGVFFIVSQVSTILIYTRTIDENSTPVHRFIAMANSNDFKIDDTLYTGRHWWGIQRRGQSGNNTTEYADPFIGEQADRLARMLGMDSYFTEQRPTGTCVAVLQPDFDDIDEKLNEIAKSLTRWAWPHMVRFEDHMDPIEFHVRKNREDIEIPQPQDDPVVKHFVSAYRAALSVPEKQQNNWASDYRHRTTRVWAQRPKKELGSLAVVNLQEAIKEDRTVLNKEIEHEIALIRNPRMVVEYWRGPRNLSGTPYCGVFIADGHADPIFARSEPAAHHEWNHESIQNDHALLEEFWGRPAKANPVKILKTKMRELLKDSNVAGRVPGSEKHYQSLTQLSSRLGSIVANAIGGTDAKVPVQRKPRVSTTEPKVGQQPRAGLSLATMFRESDDTYSVFKVNLAVPKDSLPTTATASPYLATDRGTIKRADAEEMGIAFPEVYGWSTNEKPPTSLREIPSHDQTLTIDHQEQSAFVVVRQPVNTAAGINVEFLQSEDN